MQAIVSKRRYVYPNPKLNGTRGSTPSVKQIVLSDHARDQCKERGASTNEVIQAIRDGVSEAAKKGRRIARYNFSYRSMWNEKWYAVKQVAPVYVETEARILVITVYTFYF